MNSSSIIKDIKNLANYKNVKNLFKAKNLNSKKKFKKLNKFKNIKSAAKNIKISKNLSFLNSDTRLVFTYLKQIFIKALLFQYFD